MNGAAVARLLAAAALLSCGDSAVGSGADRATAATPERATAAASGRSAPLEPVTPCPSRGALRAGASGLAVTDSTMRAAAPGADGDVAELRFVYRGPTEKVAPLASGQIRRQVGLMLRAADSCNVVYVMWRVAPQPGLVVSVKRNRGQRLHRECGTSGYRTVRPRHATLPPPLRAGASHSLRAAIDGDALEVRIDGEVVWRGDLGAEVRDLAGPPGVRSDNASLELTLHARPSAKSPPPCRQ